MKRGAIIFLAILISNSLFAQGLYDILASNHPSPSGEDTEKANFFEGYSEVDIFLATSNKKSLSELELYKGELNDVIQKFKDKSVKNQKYFLETIFYRVHNKFLKHYKNYVSFDEIFDKGYYDCITGTALYALILSELGFEFQIYESDFHVLLVVNVDESLVLFESTDFYSGYVDDEEQIVDRIAYYQNLDSQKSDDYYYDYQSNNNRFINTRQLAGLLFFNLAVEQYNLKNFAYADFYLEKAESLYSGSRTEELRNLIHQMSEKDNSFSLNK